MPRTSANPIRHITDVMVSNAQVFTNSGVHGNVSKDIWRFMWDAHEEDSVLWSAYDTLQQKGLEIVHAADAHS